MRLFLVRHGQTAWNAESRLQGHSDIPLDAVGERQARLLADAMIGCGITRVISSDLGRASATARAVSNVLGIEAEVDARLRERGFGDLEGLSVTDFHEMMAERHRVEGGEFYSIRPPGGESVMEVWERLKPIPEEFKLDGRDTLVVGHGGSTAHLLAQMLNGTIFTARTLRLGNAAITELILSPAGHFQLIRFNDSAHLAGEQRLSGTVDVSSR